MATDTRDEKALAIRDPVRDEIDALALPERKAVREMATRIRRFIKMDKAATATNAVALAHVALAHGLDPFNSEIYWAPKIGVYIGIRGLRKLARRQSLYSVDFRQMNNLERDAHGVQNGVVAVIASVFRHDLLRDAVSINAAAGTEVIPVAGIEGIGLWKRGERVPSTKSPLWVAKKRAETEGLRLAFHVDFVEVTETPGDYYEPEEPMGPTAQISRKAASTMLYGPSDDEIDNVIEGKMTEIREKDEVAQAEAPEDVPEYDPNDGVVPL